MPSNSDFNVLFIGDIIGRQGRLAVGRVLSGIKADFNIDFVIANCENVAGGFGLTVKLADELTELGIDVITSGNHIWDRREVVPHLDSMVNVLRPLNYPKGVPGRGWGIYETGDGLKVCVINLLGRVFMRAIDCPFRIVDDLLKEINPMVTIVDIHAEATSEKIAMGWYLDGRASAVVGSHTHVQTADERVLPGGTAYITDAGMTGPFDSVIGVDKRVIIERFLTGIPSRFDAATGDVRFSGVVISIDRKSRKARSIERIHRPVGSGSE
ncbi:MAG: TIGR00282 family metallophosphoesterase [Candidatus Eisenbacteria bacterium]